MRFNNGPDFYHPVTHQLVPSGTWYEGSAHVEGEGELEAISDVLTENATDQNEPEVFVCPHCGKEYKTAKGLEAHADKCPEKPSES